MQEDRLHRMSRQRLTDRDRKQKWMLFITGFPIARFLRCLFMREHQSLPATVTQAVDADVTANRRYAYGRVFSKCGTGCCIE